MENIQLPKQLEKYKEEIEKTIKPVIRIKASKRETNLFESKFGGNPYLPKDTEHPKDEYGKHMFLLAQINFEEIPEYENMPKSGILQFYVSANDNVMGLDFDDLTNQKNFRVVYHQEIVSDMNKLVTDFSYFQIPEESHLPFEHEMALNYILDKEVVSIADYQFEPLLGDAIDLEEVVGENQWGEETIWDVYAEKLSNEGHKIGGYAHFTQEDPRGYDEDSKEYSVLLLQIDTDDDNDIMWGDCGIGNFFIKKEDLKNLNFSNVIYTWDCC